MQTSSDGKKLIKHFESLRLEAYPDYERDKILWTIGWGHTSKYVTKGMKWTKEQAEEFFDKDLEKFEDAVRTLVKTRINQAQFDALVSFTYNLGQASLRGSTMLYLINQDKAAEAAQQLIRWIYDDGKIQGGLVKRRFAEQAIFLGFPLSEALDLGESRYAGYILRLQNSGNSR